MRIKWTDRRFSFDFPAGIYPEMIERVRGTPARLEDLLAGLSAATSAPSTPETLAAGSTAFVSALGMSGTSAVTVSWMTW